MSEILMAIGLLCQPYGQTCAKRILTCALDKASAGASVAKVTNERIASSIASCVLDGKLAP